MHAAGLHLLDPFACLSDTYWLSADEQPLVSAYQLVHLSLFFCGVSFRKPVHLSVLVTAQFFFYRAYGAKFSWNCDALYYKISFYGSNFYESKWSCKLECEKKNYISYCYN